MPQGVGDSSRRGFLGAAVSGLVVLAGCSQSNNGSNNEPAETRTSPESTSPASERTTQKGTSATAQESKDLENEFESQLEREELDADYAGWIEVSESMIDIPSWAEDGEAKQWHEHQLPLNHRDFTHAFMNSEADSQGTFIEHYIAFTEEIEDGEYSSDGPYRNVAAIHRIKEIDDTILGPFEIPVQPDALEKFLQENIQGVMEHGEKTDERFLELARQ